MSTPPPPPRDTKQVVRAFIAAINAHRLDRLDDLVAADFVRHSDAAGATPVRSLADLKTFLRHEQATFPDGHERVEDLVADGDRVAVRLTFRGTQHGPLGEYPPTGRVMTAQYLAIYRVEGGQIAEAWVEWDNLHGLRQLGHLRDTTGDRDT
jgi:steroid delta-isomerase-like uncharacterized protein